MEVEDMGDEEITEQTDVPNGKHIIEDKDSEEEEVEEQGIEVEKEETETEGSEVEEDQNNMMQVNGGDTTLEYSYHEETTITKFSEHKSSRRKSWMEGMNSFKALNYFTLGENS